MKKTFQFVCVSACIVAALFTSCKKQDFAIPEPLDEPQASVVTEKQASSLFNAIEQKMTTKTGGKHYNGKANVKSYKNSKGQFVYHVANYANGGFVILAADNRTSPVLAYSPTGQFDNDANNPASAIFNISSTILMDSVQRVDAQESEKHAQDWTQESIERIISYGLGGGYNELPVTDIDDGDPFNPDCECSKITVGPLLSTNWNQWAPYNNNAPIVDNGQRAPAGCVPVAMGQVMAYHQYPKQYKSHGEIALLLRDIGDILSVNYGADASGADSHDVSPSLVGRFNYKQADCDNYNLQVVLNNLNRRLPVVLSGGSKGGSWLFPKYQNGHAWVCDGYQRISTCYKHHISESLYLHMNWGWGGYKDEYYRHDLWDPNSDEGYAFDYKQHMVYNIIPK